MQLHAQPLGYHRKSEAFLDLIGAADPFNLEIPVQHREHHPNLEQGETTTGTNSGTGAEWHERAAALHLGEDRRIVPTGRVESLGLADSIGVEPRHSREQYHARALVDFEIAHHGILGRRQKGVGYHGFQTHRLVGNGIDDVELVRRLPRLRHSGSLEDAVDRFERCDHRLELGKSYAGLAAMYRSVGELDKARDSYERTRSTFRTAQHPRHAIQVLVDLAYLELVNDSLESAERLWPNASERWRQTARNSIWPSGA